MNLADFEEDSLREDVKLLAYKLWEQRGCPIGSPEEDWMQAEEMMQQGEEKAAAATA